MSPEQLDAIQARTDAASPGPWTADSEVRGDCVVWGPNGKFLMNQQAAPHWVDAPGDQKRAVSFDVDKRDGEFIAAARTDVPALLAYARDLEARIGRVDEVVHSMDQRVKQNVRNIESGLYDDRFTAVAHGVNSFAESSAIRLRAALTATEGQA